MQALPTEPHLVLKSKDMPLLRRVMKASVFILLVRLLGAAPLRLCVTVRLRVIRSACSRPCSRQVVASSQHFQHKKEVNRLPCPSGCAVEGDQVCVLWALHQVAGSTQYYCSACSSMRKRASVAVCAWVVRPPLCRRQVTGSGWCHCIARCWAGDQDCCTR